ncbi:two-component system OmpR family sensor kinase [Paenibacillus castaneae]|uniref:sensor histidine kinase n=1 Tax=Paenibacillus castaneae TaxID=474957 RepID=UPI000C9CB6B7|nr:HAMP domain-containing sensor histidine kinase [Paenibacillus castaneae]NIK74946.1 two-component system OmpR family sensor kinase [Paenibacillus castaneae]
MSKLQSNRLIRLFSPRSLRYQLLSRSLLILAVLFLLIGVLQYVLMKDFIYKNKAEALSTQIMAMPIDWFINSNNSHTPDNRHSPNNDEHPSTDNNPQRDRPDLPILYQPGLSFVFVDLNGMITDLSKNSGTSAPLLSTEQYDLIKQDLLDRKPLNYKVVRNAEGTEQLVVYRLAGPPGKAEGIIQVSTETDSLRQLLLTQLAIFTVLAILALAAGLALYLPLLRRTLQPLFRVVQATQETHAGNLTERLPIDQGQEEIDRLSEAFNGMLQRLDTAFEEERKLTERMRRFVADASHELRTPMTSIHGFLEVLLRGAATNPEQLKRALMSIQLESGRMNKLVEDLLALAKLDQDQQLLLTETQLDKLLLEMEPQLAILAGNRNVQIVIAQRVSGFYHSDKLKQVILNIFLNAVQHTDSDAGMIALTLSHEDNNAKLIIEDNGVGIQEEHLPHLFERFYRSESSRTRKNGGAGLGLAISKSIIDAHGGTIEVVSHPGEGTAFRILLPLGRSPLERE